MKSNAEGPGTVQRKTVMFKQPMYYHEDDQTEKKGGYDEKENAFIIPSPCNAGFQ
jgi:hypothetical protein